MYFGVKILLLRFKSIEMEVIPLKAITAHPLQSRNDLAAETCALIGAAYERRVASNKDCCDGALIENVASTVFQRLDNAESSKCFMVVLLRGQMGREGIAWCGTL